MLFYFPFPCAAGEGARRAEGGGGAFAIPYAKRP
jgi:hypothetical protein